MAETQVVRALLAAIACLDDIAELDPASSMAGNALENIAYDLQQMEPGERRNFLEIIEAIAADAAIGGNSDRATWIREVPVSLGVRSE
jgi:hypothetical protein